MNEQTNQGAPPGHSRRRRRRRPPKHRGGAGGSHPQRQGEGAPRPGGAPGAAADPRAAIAAGAPAIEVAGVLQVLPAGHGFLRGAAQNYAPDPKDPLVPRETIGDFALETGVEVAGLAVADRPGRPAVLAEVRQLNGAAPETWAQRRPFKDLVAESPDSRIRLEAEAEGLSMRVVDLIAPIGKGQRCLIVAPPKAGKTVLLQQIARSISTNHPEIHLVVLLVDERPEEVTDMRRNVRGEVLASSSDEMARNHVQIAEIALERCKRLVECGRDVVVLLDSITRLARAYNAEQRSSGRVLSGGIDARTMEKPRRFFGAARKAQGGGSLTVIGTALVDTGSRMDEVIFQEFKGTGNTEIVMDRRLFDMRIFPAIDISASGTRKEEMLLVPHVYQKVVLLRRALAPLKPAEAMQLLIQRLAKHASNEEFLASLG